MCYCILVRLYYIFILHQTTTSAMLSFIFLRCIISSFYIKPQLLDKIQNYSASCIISSFYIKPQHTQCANFEELGCIISSFYIKPQLIFRCWPFLAVVLYLHSTSNHNGVPRNDISDDVVLYLHSTSNHNGHQKHGSTCQVVLYLHSTSNHNQNSRYSRVSWLYYIFILHQTTTVLRCACVLLQLYYIFILHQTTTYM